MEASAKSGCKHARYKAGLFCLVKEVGVAGLRLGFCLGLSFLRLPPCKSWLSELPYPVYTWVLLSFEHISAPPGITPRVIRHLFQIVDNIKKKQKPGEKIEVTACALELYNEDLLDLSVRSGREELASKNGWDTIRATMGLKLQERPVGKDGRVVPEVSKSMEGRYSWADASHACACTAGQV
eukprot:1157275-Pelagomonas_calceolata.AAC.7